MNFLKTTPGFVFAYIALMLPTYYLPYLGSNSAVMQSIGAAGGAATDTSGPFAGLFLLHLILLVLLIAVSFVRGSVDSRKWIAVFPSIALVFDLVPGLNLIPFIPTVMHLCAIITGAKGATRVVIVEKTLSD